MVLLAELMHANHRKEELEQKEADHAAGRTGPMNFEALNDIRATTLSNKLNAVKYISENFVSGLPMLPACFWRATDTMLSAAPASLSFLLCWSGIAALQSGLAFQCTNRLVFQPSSLWCRV